MDKEMMIERELGRDEEREGQGEDERVEVKKI